MNYPDSFQRVINAFKRLPGIGTKGAERMAFHLLEMDQEYLLEFAKSLESLHEHVTYCKICGNISENSTCTICLDQTRNHKVLMVVEKPKDVFALENIQLFEGVYHVLNGCISIMNGVLADDLRIDELLERVHGGVEEVIIATNPTRDGETTALYLAKLLEQKGIHVTRIANGIPMGGHLDYADQMTLIKSFEGRRKI